MLEEDTINDGKTLAIISYFTFIGTLIALVMNIDKKNPFIAFHVRQMLGLIMMLIVSNVTEKYIDSWFGTGLWAVTFICWLYGLLYAIRGEYKPIPYIGDKFQEWFKNIG